MDANAVVEAITQSRSRGLMELDEDASTYGDHVETVQAWKGQGRLRT